MMTETAKKYGGSLYELALEESMDTQVLEQLQEVLALLTEDTLYIRLLSEPSIPKGERIALLDEAFGDRIWPYLLNFMKILCEKGYLGQLRGCMREYKRRYNEAHGSAEATVTSAKELTAQQKEALLKKLEALSGKKVDMTVYINPALIGGLRLDMEGKRYDGSAKHRLDELGSIIENTAM